MRLELDADRGHAIGDAGLDLAHVIQLRQPVLDRLDEQSLQVDRVGTRIHTDDEGRAELDVRVFLAWHGEERRHAQCRDAGKGHQRELVAADRELQQRHGTRTGSPSSR